MSDSHIIALSLPLFYITDLNRFAMMFAFNSKSNSFIIPFDHDNINFSFRIQSIIHNRMLYFDIGRKMEQAQYGCCAFF